MLKYIISRRLVWGYALYNWLILKHRNVSYDSYPKISGKIFITGSGQLKFGKGVRINSCLAANPIGGDSRTILSIGSGAALTIGDYTGISNAAIICNESIIIGKHVKIGGGVKIYDSDFHSLDAQERSSVSNDIAKTASVAIGDYSFIGAHSIILKGVSIGKHAIIGAGSVVTKSIPESEIWGGNPAKFIKTA